MAKGKGFAVGRTRVHNLAQLCVILSSLPHRSGC